MIASARLKLVVISALAAIMAGCGNGSPKDGAKKTESASFPYVKVPSIVADGDKPLYFASHFWDAFLMLEEASVADTTRIGAVSRDEVEQAAANYVKLLSGLPLEDARGCTGGLASRLEDYAKAHPGSTLPEDLSEVLSRYLYDPNSPVRDEDIYTPFAANLSVCSFLPQSRRDTYAKDARESALCPRGSKAAAFRFQLKNGKKLGLYDIKADYTILFFSNPGCHACKDIIDALRTNEMVTSCLSAGVIAVLNIYIDEDLAEWYNYMSFYPTEWYNGFDPNHIIRDDELYNVRAIPSLYLLGADKTVLLKDCTTDKLLYTLSTLL